MKASEARVKSFNSAISELDDIKHQIIKACELKQMSINVTDLSRAAIDSLIADGYKVDQSQAMNYNIFIIKW